ncbi:hypothetical protein QFZ20_005186 [Flavobacterium sp. W4I14]|nr:hypothetical protein [Flavobacterium sp. W4I14]
MADIAQRFIQNPILCQKDLLPSFDKGNFRGTEIFLAVEPRTDD